MPRVGVLACMRLSIAGRSRARRRPRRCQTGIAALLSLLLLAATAGPALAGFQPQQTFDTGLGPVWVAVADFNGDGKPDLATANNGADNVSVLLNATTPG